MGRLIDGVWSNEDLGADAKGRFVRRAAKFRGVLGTDAHPAVTGRYRLYVAHACGWSHRTLLFRALQGLEDVIEAVFVDPFMGEQGWRLDDGTPLYEVYLSAAPDYTGRVSVPALWDLETGKIVCNESKDIVASLDGPLNHLARHPRPLFPDGEREAIDAMIEANYGPVNDGVYRCGFAANQEAHEQAAWALFNRLDELESLLGKQRYLLGETVSAADWYLFPTLYRFDSVYHTHFKCNLRRLTEYPNLWAYTRELYQWPGVRETCRMKEIKEHYYRSHESIHPRRYVPIGPILDFDEAHGRGS